jgi:hypothetical protein
MGYCRSASPSPSPDDASATATPSATPVNNSCSLDSDCRGGDVCDQTVCTAAPSNNHDYFVTSFRDNKFNNQTGLISLLGTVNGGFKTVAKDTHWLIMASIFFKVKSTSQSVISFENSSFMNGPLEGTNIITNKLNLTINPNSSSPSASPCLTTNNESIVGDFNGDGSINVLDITLVISHFGKVDDSTKIYDLNNDETIDINDLINEIGNFLSGGKTDTTTCVSPSPSSNPSPSDNGVAGDTDGDGDPDSTDCAPNNKDVFHKQAKFFQIPLDGKTGTAAWDYNCDGKITPILERFTSVHSTTVGPNMTTPDKVKKGYSIKQNIQGGVCEDNGYGKADYSYVPQSDKPEDLCGKQLCVVELDFQAYDKPACTGNTLGPAVSYCYQDLPNQGKGYDQVDSTRPGFTQGCQ